MTYSIERWGLPAPDEAPAAWGARTIGRGASLDVVIDRTSWHGTTPAKAVLKAVLNDEGAFKIAIDEWARLQKDGEVRHDQAKLVVLYDGPKVRIEANTNASFGYVYLVAYVKPGVVVPRYEPYGYADAKDVAEVARIKALADSDERKTRYRGLVGSRPERYPGVTEVYMVLFRKDDHALFVNRNYSKVGEVPADEAKALVDRSVALNMWEGYSLSQYPGEGSGLGVWLGYPGSREAVSSQVEAQEVVSAIGSAA